MKKILVALFVCVLLPAGVAFAEGFRNGHGSGPLMRLFHGLELSADQKAQLLSLRESRKEMFKGDLESVRKTKIALFDYLKQGGNDSGQIAALIAASTDAQQKLESDGANTFLEAYKMLTAEQQKKLSEKSFEGFGGGRHQGWGQKQL